jgi:hypothetical protein
MTSLIKTATIFNIKLSTCSPCWAAGDPGWTAVTKIPTSFPPVSRMPTLPFFWKEMKRGSGLKQNDVFKGSVKIRIFSKEVLLLNALYDHIGPDYICYATENIWWQNEKLWNCLLFAWYFRTLRILKSTNYSINDRRLHILTVFKKEKTLWKKSKKKKCQCFDKTKLIFCLIIIEWTL